jgi:hypothetical protein
MKITHVPGMQKIEAAVGKDDFVLPRAPHFYLALESVTAEDPSSGCLLLFSQWDLVDGGE